MGGVHTEILLKLNSRNLEPQLVALVTYSDTTVL